MTAPLTRQGPLLLRNRDFALVWLGQVFAQGGTRVYQIGLLWWLLGQLPEHARGLASGAFLVVGALPSLLLVRPIGRLLDRAPSRRVMLRAELVACAVVTVLALFAFADSVALWAVYPVGLVLAVCQAVFDPCLSKSVPELVDEADIERAVGFEASTQSVANFAGAAFGAVLLATIGFAGAVALNAVTYALAAGCLWVARFRRVPAAAQGVAESGSGTGEPVGTWAFLGSLPGVRPLLGCFAAANFFATPTLLILPLYTRSVLHAGADTLSRLETALWLGLLVGAFAAGHVRVRGRTARFGAACIAAFALCLGVPGLVDASTAYLVALAVGGACLGMSNVKFTALFQRVVPDGVKGRFFAALQAAVSLTFPVAFLGFGALGDTVAPQVLCLVQAGGLVLVAGLLATMREPVATPGSAA
ncbi:MFS transporter [Solihabitans fulvus]|uniref:MFS transporter n=1 Tax=Solihabitans fulvus TaxID=1892852 RepID=UPI001661B18F|nr:MFS transporter [Solihabitans fulvus]